MRNVQFVTSYAKVEDIKESSIPEFCFIGRSNVGKSSLINAVTNKKSVAKVSGTPGKTRLINFFKPDEDFYLVDLPGYGFAKLPKPERKKLEEMIHDYLLKSKNLFLVFLLIDSRIPPQKIDLEFIEYMGENNVPFHIIFTKADKAVRNKRPKEIQIFLNTLQKTWSEVPPYYVTSSAKHIGIEELQAAIMEMYG